ncbi:MAG: kelch repeat-containing protein, partial [Terracidiphilus sp.]
MSSRLRSAAAIGAALVVAFLIGASFAGPAAAHAQGTFTATGSMSIGRDNATLTLLQNGQVLVAGGNNSSGVLASAELYDPATGTWSVTGSMTTARYTHTATLLPSGLVLITGGSDGPSNYSSAELYNPATGTFTATGSMSAARQNQTATLLQNGQVLVAGGNDGNNILASAELYDPSTGIFTLTGSMHTARYVPTATLLQNGQVLVAGGVSSPNPTYQSSAELYDPIAGTFSFTTGSMSTPRGYFMGVLLGDGQVLITGGASGSGNLRSAELYNSSTETFTLTGSMSGPQGPPATLLGNGQVLVIGGYNGSYLASTELYNPSAGTFSAAATMTVARDGATAVLLQDGQVLVAGGSASGSNVLASTELYTPTSSISVTGNGSAANVCPNGQTAPRPCSAPITVQFSESGADFGASSVQVVTQGAASLDFTLASTTCTGSPASCTVNVTFAPQAPGLRLGAVILTDADGDLVASVPISGIGNGPAIAFGPGVQSTIPGTKSWNPQGVALDSAGDVFIADSNNNQVVEIPAGGTGAKVLVS